MLSVVLIVCLLGGIAYWKYVMWSRKSYSCTEGNLFVGWLGKLFVNLCMFKFQAVEVLYIKKAKIASNCDKI